MEFKPHDYQEYVMQMLREVENCGLLLEMGLGKTVSTLCVLEELINDYYRANKALVVAPLRVAQDTWPDEIQKWDQLKGLRVSSIMGTEKERLRGLYADADIYLINRENVAWLIELHGDYRDKKKRTGFHLTKRWKFDTLVLDELSNYKDPTIRRFKLLEKVRPYLKRIIGLTGTPAPNSLIDLWAQIYLLDGGQRLGYTFKQYKDQYFDATKHTKNVHGKLIDTAWALKPGAEDAIYAAISDICVSMKSIDHLKLPPVFFKYSSISLPPAARKSYKELEKDSIVELANGDIIDAASASSVSSKLHQLAQGAIYNDPEERTWTQVHDEKIEALADKIEALAGNPVLVFYWFQHDLQRLKAKFKNAGTLEGTADIKKWNEGKTAVLLVHPMSAGHGLNLQHGGHNIVWFSLTWSLELYQQANARLNRQGQTKPVSIDHLIVKDSVDEKIMDVLLGKAERQDALMDAVKAVLTKYKR